MLITVQETEAIKDYWFRWIRTHEVQPGKETRGSEWFKGADNCVGSWGPMREALLSNIYTTFQENVQTGAFKSYILARKQEVLMIV